MCSKNSCVQAKGGGHRPVAPLNTPLDRNIGSRTRSDLSKHDQSLSEEPEIKYDDPRLEMSHLGCDLVRHFQPRVHHIWMSNSLLCITVLLVA